MEKIIIIISILVVFCIIAESIIWAERNERKKLEQELEATKESLKEVCEKTIKNNDNICAKITYEAYFGRPVDHTGDGFIDGYE